MLLRTHQDPRAPMGAPHLADLLDALQRHVRQHVGLDATQEDVVVHLVHHLLLLGTPRTGG